MGYKLKKEFEGFKVERVIVGFGQQLFNLSEMKEEEIAKWIKRGAKIEEFFEETKGGGTQESEEDKAKKEALKQRFEKRVSLLLEKGFVRVSEKFTKGEVSILAKKVVEISDEEFDKFVSESENKGDEEPGQDQTGADATTGTEANKEKEKATGVTKTTAAKKPKPKAEAK